jgi:hypothetical protein
VTNSKIYKALILVVSMAKRSLIARIGLPIALIASLAGCGGMPVRELPGKPFRYGYRVESDTAVMEVRVAAGIAVGTIGVKKTANGYHAEGSFSEFTYPEAMEKALDVADQNDDMYVTEEEAKRLANAAMRVAAK